MSTHVRSSIYWRIEKYVLEQFLLILIYSENKNYVIVDTFSGSICTVSRPFFESHEGEYCDIGLYSPCGSPILRIKLLLYELRHEISNNRAF